MSTGALRPRVAGWSRKMNITAAMMTMNHASVLYSRMRNAIAPSWMASEISLIFWVPTSALFTCLVTPQAINSERIPMTTIDASGLENT